MMGRENMGFWPGDTLRRETNPECWAERDVVTTLREGRLGFRIKGLGRDQRCKESDEIRILWLG